MFRSTKSEQENLTIMIRNSQRKVEVELVNLYEEPSALINIIKSWWTAIIYIHYLLLFFIEFKNIFNSQVENSVLSLLLLDPFWRLEFVSMPQESP